MTLDEFETRGKEARNEAVRLLSRVEMGCRLRFSDETFSRSAPGWVRVEFNRGYSNELPRGEAVSSIAFNLASGMKYSII